MLEPPRIASGAMQARRRSVRSGIRDAAAGIIDQNPPRHCSSLPSVSVAARSLWGVLDPVH
ncbi:hypothetical protein [Streptomyces sp. NPDC050988]|uniref:hypothetical protein n=1 Tax=Streptomyces sp. NPDC050988 TaxID=3365637 RepID=UPI0037A545F7